MIVALGEENLRVFQVKPMHSKFTKKIKYYNFSSLINIIFWEIWLYLMIPTNRYLREETKEEH